jgi:hypothetical protein
MWGYILIYGIVISVVFWDDIHNQQRDTIQIVYKILTKFGIFVHERGKEEGHFGRKRAADIAIGNNWFSYSLLDVWHAERVTNKMFQFLKSFGITPSSGQI